MNKWSDDAWNKRHLVIYKCQVSALYHRKRERFYSLLDKTSSTFALIGGSAAMSEFLPTPESKAFAGGLIALFAIPAVVLSWADKSKDHAVLASRFIAVEAEIEGAGVIDSDLVGKFMEKAVAIEAKEPPQLPTLTRICQNEVARATDHNGHVSKIKWWESLLSQWIAI